ncbi:hypothetical protein [Streptomyces sp. NPDC058664]|uniref:hypothetical protein n=1 Tax=unclassified Streptomyces TaxID=2593676 RepID=UPI003647C390
MTAAERAVADDWTAEPVPAPDGRAEARLARRRCLGSGPADPGVTPARDWP